tara:strand:- start:1001 stop:1234 length:234 start_codon:yes stop_codon:yes gene_type:complete
MKTLEITSEDIFTCIGTWVTIHSIYLDGEFIGKSSDAVGKLKELDIDLSKVSITDEHTKNILKDVYRSEFIISRYAS